MTRAKFKDLLLQYRVAQTVEATGFDYPHRKKSNIATGISTLCTTWSTTDY